ncbi:DUF4398 domain-containing protein [Haliangium ochraceum]|nr:DUF4398 domain-containing protein [Haliangium ochraceum]
MGACSRLVVLALAAVLCCGLAVSAGCGSALYLNQVTRKASTAVAAAESADAETFAPYHYTLAVHYLRKAKEEAAAADFQAANRFGLLSQEAAETARTLAVERSLNREDESWRPPPGAPGYQGPTPGAAEDAEAEDAEDDEVEADDAAASDGDAAASDAGEMPADAAAGDQAEDAMMDEGAAEGDADVAEDDE